MFVETLDFMIGEYFYSVEVVIHAYNEGLNCLFIWTFYMILLEVLVYQLYRCFAIQSLWLFVKPPDVLVW